MTPALLLRYWWVLALAILIALCAWQGGSVRDAKARAAHEAQIAAQARSDLRKALRANTVTAAVSAKVEKRQVEIRYVTRTLVEKVPVYVSPEVDRSYPLPVGLVRLHDAAASGQPPVPGGAGELDDSPSPVVASTLARTIVGNYGEYHACRAQVMGWIDWYRQQQQVWNER